MAKMPPTIKIPFDEKAIKDPEMRAYIRDLVKRLVKMYEEVAGVVNLNRDKHNEPVSTTAASTGAGTVKMGSANPANSAGFVELETGKHVPYWSNPEP